MQRAQIANHGLQSALAICLFLLGCADGRNERVFARGDGSSPDRSEPAVPVAVAPALVGPIASYYENKATLVAEKEADVLARVSGIVQSIAVEEGDVVEEGKSLLKIENDEYRFLVEQAASNTRNVRTKLDRITESKDLVSAEQFDIARNALETAQADEELARLNLSYTDVTAPFKGRIVHRYAEVGRNVSAGTPLFTLADFEPLLARVGVSAKQFGRIQVDQTVELVLDSTKERLQGRIKLVSPTIDAKTGTIKVTVEVPEYPKETRPGDFAEVRIVTERRETATIVPASAVITDKVDQVVFVVAGDLAERRIVEVGFKDEVQAEIISGVAPGERVVVKGQRALKHGTRLKVVEEGRAAAQGAVGLSS